MNHNDVMRSVRYLLDASDARMVEIAALGGATVTVEEMRGFLKAEEDEGRVAVGTEVMARFLNGVIVARRGPPDPARPQPPLETAITNNVVLKKLRVAFELQDADLHAIFVAAGCPISKPELSALFRKPGNSHYRACEDQFLRYFLKGLASRLRP